jgi:hypothetical protein
MTYLLRQVSEQILPEKPPKRHQVPQSVEKLATAVGDLSGSTNRGADVFTGPGLGGTVLEPSIELKQLVSEAIGAALNCLWEGGVLVPGVFTIPAALDGARSAEERLGTHAYRMFGDHRRIDTDLDRSLQMARSYVDVLTPDKVSSYAWVFDGYAGANHGEAVMVEAAEIGSPYAWRLAARYRFSKRGIDLLDKELIELGTVTVPFNAG